MSKPLKDRVIIVTGAAGGIGRACAVTLAEAGAKLVVTDIVDCDATVAAIRKTNNDAAFIRADDRRIFLPDPAFSAYLEKLRERQPIGRFGRPSEVGEAVVWLMSDAASFVTGASISVDGGSLAGSP
jgi:NAD(P)-dependent dehydrogenase (short-subunit alcohol dehydrogenase family)